MNIQKPTKANRFNQPQGFDSQLQNQYIPQQNMHLPPNTMLHHESWRGEGGLGAPNSISSQGNHFNQQYQVGVRNKKPASTAIDFMNHSPERKQNSRANFSLQMLRSVQQTMPNLPNVSFAAPNGLFRYLRGKLPPIVTFILI